MKIFGTLPRTPENVCGFIIEDTDIVGILKFNSTKMLCKIIGMVGEDNPDNLVDKKIKVSCKSGMISGFVEKHIGKKDKCFYKIKN